MKLAILKNDPYLEPYRKVIEERRRRAEQKKERFCGGEKGLKAGKTLADFAVGHHHFGLRREQEWIFREWAPGAREIFLIGDFSRWEPREEFRLRPSEAPGEWELRLPPESLNHGDLYKMLVRWDGGEGIRIPAYARRVVQDKNTHLFAAQVWAPPETFTWEHPRPSRPEPLLIYESHIGMAQEEGKVGTFEEFRREVLPRVEAGGYNALQLMALMEHPYYGSFGYQVSSFFALSSRFGTPEEFKALVDDCHRRGIAVIMDLVHSHSVRNEEEGLSRQDGSEDLYFYPGDRGYHPAWDSRCFDYGKDQVIHFLLSSCAYWLTEYNIDGFRFDGVTSMLYKDHGLGASFDNYEKYFGPNVEEDALDYLVLANDLIHGIHPEAITIAEDMSGLPGIAMPYRQGGTGFDYRLAMGIPDFWIKTIKEQRDEEWHVERIWETLTNRRAHEGTIAYAESHDQALVGDKTIIFRLMDAAMYDQMGIFSASPLADRGVALHKLIRLLTFSLGGSGYMTFMGNEFGHPEWIDFPREGNGWSHHYARRQWSLADNPGLRYHGLGAFDQALLTRCSSCLTDPWATDPVFHVADQILSYRRGGFYFFINLNSTESYTDRPFGVPPGEYRQVLHSDDPAFCGHGRMEPHMTFKVNPPGDTLKLYLPSRCGVVFYRQGD